MNLGDIVFHFTRITGIKYLVDFYHKKTGKKCKCNDRRKKWNKIKLKKR
tara:strand:+ start:251 stop:397 length:147 start_codon:yes stop_codon:yes gene_type:complete